MSCSAAFKADGNGFNTFLFVYGLGTRTEFLSTRCHHSYWLTFEPCHLKWGDEFLVSPRARGRKSHWFLSILGPKVSSEIIWFRSIAFRLHGSEPEKICLGMCYHVSRFCHCSCWRMQHRTEPSGGNNRGRKTVSEIVFWWMNECSSTWDEVEKPLENDPPGIRRHHEFNSIRQWFVS